jgi:hypothetical protein
MHVPGHVAQFLTGKPGKNRDIGQRFGDLSFFIIFKLFHRVVGAPLVVAASKDFQTVPFYRSEYDQR